MKRRAALLLIVLVCACVAAAATPAATLPGSGSAAPLPWDPGEIATTVGAGLLGPSVAEFHPGEPLLWGDLGNALLALGHPLATPPPDANVPVTIRELDARLVAALGLQPAARAILSAARAAGLKPIASLGTETVARLAGLRLNHPAAQDGLELQPAQPATRAEAAYSLARALIVSDWQKQQILTETAGLALPPLDDWQRTVLTRALRFVGDPYVFSGTSEKGLQTLWDGTIVPGGFDCSGFVWRVYKLSPFAGAPGLSDVLQGRTTYAMSGEVPPAERLPIDDLEPADVVFFGSNGATSTPAQVGHMGIYVGDGWFVHSSSDGVTLQPLTGWYQTRFAWARRPLAEAGLEPGAAATPVPAT